MQLVALTAVLLLCAMSPRPVAAVSPIIGNCGNAGFADGAEATAQFDTPSDVALAAGVLYVADTGNGRLRSVANKVVSTVVSGLVGPTAVAAVAHPAGGGVLLYVADANAVLLGHAANGTMALLAGHRGCAGCLDERGFVNGVAEDARFSAPMGIAVSVDRALLFVADTGSDAIRQVELEGPAVVTTLAGSGNSGFLDGHVLQARFDRPTGVATAAAGTVVFVSDGGNAVVRKIYGLNVATVAGRSDGFSDGGALTSARFGAVTAVAVAGGVLLVSDGSNDAVRRVADGLVGTIATATSLDGALLLPRGAALAGPALVVASSGKHCLVTIADVNRTVATDGVPASMSGAGGRGAPVVFILVLLFVAALLLAGTTAGVCLVYRRRGRQPAAYRVGAAADDTEMREDAHDGVYAADTDSADDDE
jgi:hypothetical protein